MSSSVSAENDQSPGRDEMLASFQDVTGIYDVDACLRLLENCRWNLQEAIETALAVGSDLHRTLATTGTAVGTTANADVEMLTPQEIDSRNVGSAANTNPFRALLQQNDERNDDIFMRQPPLELDSYQEAVGVPRWRILHFNVTYNGKQYEFTLRDEETIGDLKKYIAKELSPLEPTDMDLRGWRGSGEPDEVVLSSLHLPAANSVHLLAPGRPSCSSDLTNGGTAESKPSDARQYRLDVYDKENDRTHQLTVPANNTVGDVKRNVYDLTNLAPSRQAWTGWPVSSGKKLEDNAKISTLNLDTPVHRLRVERSSGSANYAWKEAVDTDSSDEEQSVDGDAMNVDHLSPGPADEHRVNVPLIPADYASITEAMENFIRVYESRYGDNHPVFAPSSIEDAVRVSCHAKPKDRRPLMIYLHNDGSVSANVFATQVFSAPAVVEFLNANFTVWAWDCSLAENKNKFLLMLSTQLGSSLAYELRELENDRYPILLFVHKAKGALDVEQVLKAPCNLDEMMTTLVHALETFTNQQRLDVLDEEEREARERMRYEQEKAYQDSLDADRIKAEQKRAEEQRLKAEQQSKEEEELKHEQERERLANELPDEPPESARATTIRLRLPTDEIVERRFRVQEKLATLLTFAGSKGFKVGKYRLVTGYPKKDLASLDASKTLEELKLCPRETVFVEEM